MKQDQQYKYYLLGETMPIRVTFNRGLKLGAETPDPEKGDLVPNMGMLSRIEQSPEVEEISATDFAERCKEFYTKKNSSPIIGPG